MPTRDVRRLQHRHAGIRAASAQGCEHRASGFTHIKPVESNQSPRIHPFIGTTVSLALMFRSALNSFASSATVKPWRAGSGRYSRSCRAPHPKPAPARKLRSADSADPARQSACLPWPQHRENNPAWPSEAKPERRCPAHQPRSHRGCAAHRPKCAPAPRRLRQRCKRKRPSHRLCVATPSAAVAASALKIAAQPQPTAVRQNVDGAMSQSCRSPPDSSPARCAAC